MSRGYENPAKHFLKTNNVESLAEIILYTNFLRSESGLSDNPPIDLDAIYQRFGIPQPQQVPLRDQQGATVPFNGIPQILLREDDPILRQRFTQAHEVIELLFMELPGKIRLDRLKENIFGSNKERICQIGAAHLLMPEGSFGKMARKWGLSLKSAGRLAKEFEVSLIAALFRLVDQFPDRAAIILWRQKNKPSELKRETPIGQISMPGFSPNPIASQKLRVEWTYGQFKNEYIPKDKSANEDSAVYQAWNSNSLTMALEKLPFGRLSSSAHLENKPIRIEDEVCILTLISDGH